MGIIDKVKDATGIGKSKSEKLAEQEGWGEDVIEEDEGVTEDIDFEEDEEEEENDLDKTWDSEYDFVADHVTKAGFTDMVDFIDHAMFHEINKSPLYRDRIEHGVNTMNRISNVKEQMDQVQGGGSMDIEDKVNKVRSANQLIDEVSKLEGEDEQFMREVVGLGKEYADILRQRTAERPSSDTEVVTEEKGGRL